MKQLSPIGPEGAIFHDLLIIPGHSEKPLLDGAIYIKGSDIIDVGTLAEVESRNPSSPKVSMKGYLACPGLVNAHTHASMSFFRDLGHDRVLPTTPGNSMIEDFFFPSEKELTADLIEPLAYSYLVDGLKSGVTFFGDAYFFARGTCQAIDRLGVRGAVAEHHADLGGPLPAGRELWKKTKAWIEDWDFPTITPVVYAHAADTVSREFMNELNDFAVQNQLPFHMHLSQTSGERDRVLTRERMSPVAFAKECGVLRPKTLLVHLLSADEQDIKLLADSGATAGLCPVSEILYEHAPLGRQFVEAGIPIALGTDCAASNDGSDILNEAKVFGLMLRMQGLDHSKSSPHFLLDTITKNGAEALGSPWVGAIKPNKKADIVFMKTGLGVEPQSDPMVNFFYTMGAKQVRHVMVDGQWVLVDGELAKVSEADLRDQFIQALKEIKSRTNLPMTVPTA
ncbi:amidohydrolase family protein [Pseudobacteriovorax antillogorgiicola]|uniref:5-methylthioadenosine/S-adenosylhomocysteine deaminase n=1 Tax=Pseudobacteriovorax antillogorgiicola TaxID=1513793 RepID=A0A1Y6CBF9_9BACT|nr:amidohydrolase family protein [Pseudobacteriovorax antillogorgiicola]TCS48616.1 5-methylthioadenosine/S-adenosylhomocysteine deaminase [Pseudobacteriovorax antillogorgiicola]SMF55467.1 5-methylthioadenosine/S-adenosylhomocysteine deaminase [Pseudobacteriovorax antillogorgiicola]